MDEMIVRKTLPQAVLPAIEEWQPAFFACRGRLCPPMPSALHAERYLEFLKHLIKRKPRDLTAHTRRILLARAYRHEAVVREALLDLFHLLGRRGAGLRKHLLAICAPLLDAQTRYRLQRADSPPETTPIVIHSQAQEAGRHEADDQQRSRVAEAIAYLENGQVDEARILLESHLKSSPGDIEATRILLDIYQRARDFVAFAALRERLGPLPDAVRPLWEEAAARFAPRG